MLGKLFAWMVTIILLCTGMQQVAYADAIATVTTPAQLTAAPLLVTAYHLTNNGKNLRTIELYNDGKTIQDLGAWQIAATSDTNVAVIEATMSLAPFAGKYIQAGTHITLDVSDPANNLVWPPLNAAATSIQMIAAGYSPSVAYVNGVTDVMYRVLNASGYSTAKTTSFTNAHRVAANGTPYSGAVFYDDGFYVVPPYPTGLHIIEIYPYSSNCSPFDTSILCGDYIKIANDSVSTAIELDEYVLRTDSSSASRTSANTFTLSGTLQPGEVRSIYLTDAGTRLSLTNSGGYVWFEDMTGMAVYKETVTNYASAGSSLQGYAYALAPDGTWQWTATPMPFADNEITAVVQGCAEGKYFNPDTNRCRTLEDALTALTPCQAGYERSVETNRCRKLVAASALTPCKEGQIRSLQTNRCRAAESAEAQLQPCKEGYERNPATNRCRKAAVAGASTDYPVQPYGESSHSSAAWWALGAVAAVALGYGAWEWRQELATVVASIAARFRH